jgi:hypothetical protein
MSQNGNLKTMFGIAPNPVPINTIPDGTWKGNVTCVNLKSRRLENTVTTVSQNRDPTVKFFPASERKIILNLL